VRYRRARYLYLEHARRCRNEVAMAHPVQASGVDWLARVRGRRGPRPYRSSISIRIAAFASTRPATLGNRMSNLIVQAARVHRELTTRHVQFRMQLYQRSDCVVQRRRHRVRRSRRSIRFRRRRASGEAHESSAFNSQGSPPAAEMFCRAAIASIQRGSRANRGQPASTSVMTTAHQAKPNAEHADGM
jgi:hypothetical protein